MEPFTFASSASLKLPVSIRLVGLEGEEMPFADSTLATDAALRHVGANTSTHSDVYATAQVWAGSKPLTVPVQTAYRAFFHQHKAERRWNEWLTLPVTYASLPADARVAVTVWDVVPGGRAAFGGTTIPLFDRDNQLRKGRYKCVVHRRAEADGCGQSTPAFPREAREEGRGGAEKRRNKQTGSRSGDYMAETDGTDTDTADVDSLDPEAEMDRMDRLFKKHEMGEIPRVEWLDQLVYRGFERRSMQGAGSGSVAGLKVGAADGEGFGSGPNRRPGPSRFVLSVEFPRFDFPIVFVDHEYPPPAISSLQNNSNNSNLSGSQSGLLLRPPPEVHFGPGIGESGVLSSADGDGRLVRVYDPEVGARDNPAESKNRRLVRSQHRHGKLDKDLKPNAKVRDELNGIMAYPPTQALTSEEKDLVWKFRYHLTREKKAVTKFVKSVHWQDAAEARQAEQVLGRWANIDVDDALELLGPTFDHRAVRAYAVERLRKADDGELQLYLLQLVQALKFERGADEGAGGRGQGEAGAETGTENNSESEPERNESGGALARFLISRAAGNLLLGNDLYWYLMVECDDHSPEQSAANRAMYRRVAYDFMAELERRPGGAETRRTLRRQAEWVAVMAKLSGDVKEANESMARRSERARQFLLDAQNELATIDPPLPLPLDPRVEIVGVATEEAVTVFKSSLHPIKVAFRDRSGRTYPILFKMGDDLRQDQLVIQIITLMDQLLRKENLDLRLTPYRILATSSRMGLTQFVPSVSLAALAARYKGAPNAALAYLRKNNPDASAPLGLRRDTLDTFVKSCAGYCVITYILGVGDRHLDNLLLAPDGHFFHADFGFILGRDPKPFAPAMKLSKEMVEAMGGSSSEHYRQFKQYCFLAYSALRKSSNLILNLFSLMVDANIPDILWEPDKTVLKVQERFHLELNEEDAIRHLERVIDDNLNAFVPVVIDRLHEFVQAFRA